MKSGSSLNDCKSTDELGQHGQKTPDVPHLALILVEVRLGLAHRYDRANV